MSMEQVLDSARRIVAKWTSNSTPLKSDAPIGSTVLEVNNTIRFRNGDEVMLMNTSINSSGAETFLIIDEILDTTHLSLTTPTKIAWTTADNSVLVNTFLGQFIQAVYIGEPDPIPKFPAITINPISRDSEWMTLDSTKETYKLEINVYVQSGNQEETMRFLMRMVDDIQFGLKKNIMPLVGPFSTTAVSNDVSRNDIYIKVNDTSIFTHVNGLFPRAIIEDMYKAEELMITEIVDGTTIKIMTPVCFNYLVTDGAKVISPESFIYNSWPDSITYGSIFKGTLLKAAKINWFATEEQLNIETPIDTSLT